MEPPVTFGEWLRQRRNELKLTRKEFAGRVGCSISALRKIEDGERRPSAQIAELMANCLNIPPEGRATFVRVARGELSVDRLSPAPPSATTPAPPRTNLPVLPTPMIGRQGEVEQLSQLLGDPQCRLLTLVGSGGIGKTRLAIEAAAHIQDEFAGGVYFVPLAPVNTARFIVPVVADSIGFAFQSASHLDPKTQLFSYLKEKRALLLLDNLEQLLVEPGIELLTELLSSAPQVKLLTTSRESLGLQEEWVYEVQGLPVPESKYEKSRAQNTSVELFLQRARRAYIGFDATPVDYPAIVRICQLVEGNPLGIELAAAWVRTLSCADIAGEIERGLGFLGVSTRDIPARHRSLRAVFDHSWKLLLQEEQAVLSGLSIFRGGFQREAAQAVAGATLAILSSLVTKSIVRRSSNGRYDLHELIRQFALERLSESPEEQVATQARQGSYYLTLFSLAVGRIHSAAQREALAELTAEMDNFRTGWEWAVAQGEFALIEQTLRTFATLFDMRGWLQEGCDLLNRPLKELEVAQAQSAFDKNNQLALGHILTVRALLASRLGQHDQARQMLERSLDILRPLHEPRVLVEAVTFLGLVLELTGNYARALELYTEGLEVASQIGDRWFAALCFTCVNGLVGFTQSLIAPETRHARWQSAVADWRLIGDPRFIAIGLNNLSLSALWLGRYEEARLALEESVALGISVGDRWGLGYAYRGLGTIAQAQGEHLEALAMFHKSIDTLGELGARQDVARVLTEMGRSVFALGNDVEAGRIWRQALRIATETKGTFIALEALLGLASLRARSGDVEQAFELLWIVLDHPASVQDTQNRAARLRSELEAQLTSQQVQAARERVKTLEAAVHEVLKPVEGD